MFAQHTFFTSSPSENLFYLEFSINKDDQYCLHLSFATCESANKNFSIMEKEWGLPVILEVNQIMVFPAADSKSPGVYQSIVEMEDFSPHHNIGIRFSSNEHAGAFFKFAKAAIHNKNIHAQIPKMSYGRTCIYFDKRDLIHPDYLLDRRVSQMNSIIDLIVKIHAVFMNNGMMQNKDIVNYCMNNWLLHEMQKSDYVNRFIELNRHFPLHNPRFLLPRQNKKIDVSVGYSTNETSSGNKCSLYLACLYPEKFDELYKIVAQCGLSIEKVSADTICISPSVKSSVWGNIYGVTVFDFDPATLSIEFISEMDRYNFLEAINIVNTLIKERKNNNKSVSFNTVERFISFEKNALPEFIPQQGFSTTAQNENQEITVRSARKRRSNCVIS